MKFIKYTPQEYLSKVNEEIKRIADSPRYKSAAKSIFVLLDGCDPMDFDFWEFTSDNWNGYDILRHILTEHWGDSTQEIDLKYFIFNDQKYIFAFWRGSFYEISWYKDRGRTEKIFRNGEPISLFDYLVLYNRLTELWEDTR